MRADTSSPPSNAAFPLSFAQERIWLVDRLLSGAAYNVLTAVRLSGPLQIPVLERTLNEIASRHEALRTTIHATDDGPRQMVADTGRLPLIVADVSATSPAEREAEVRRRLREDASQAFDLTAGPLARCLAVRLGPDEHVVQLTMHHAVCDAWSLGIIIREIGLLYDAFATGRPSPLPDLTLQYVDYALWQRRMAGSAQWQRQREYWRQHLAGASVTELPTDRPRGAIRATAGRQVGITIDAALTTALRSLAHETGATMFMALLAGFQGLLSIYTGQTDILVGTPVVDRPRRELESLVGLFLNTIVVRTNLGGHPTFRQLLARVRDVTLQAFANQDVPFEQVIDELHPQRDAARNPLFEVLFTLQNASHERLRLGGLDWRREEAGNDTAKFDLTLLVQEHGDSLSGTFDYRSDLFDADTIERLARHYLTLLRSAVGDPDHRMGRLTVLDPDERRAVLDAWNNTGGAVTRCTPVHEQFERASAERPDRLALVAEDGRLTFGDLEEQANRLARHLRRRGAGPGRQVAICLERSSQLAIAVLATLKAGAAYVPLDPASPPERLRYMVADSGASLLVTADELLTRLGPLAAAETIVRVNGDAAAIAAEATMPVGVHVHPLDIGYVLYTSGSTGRPKGVALPHAALSNLVEWYANEMAVGPALQFASIGFDASFLEMLGPWAQGSAVHIAPEAVRADPNALTQYIGRHGIEKVFLPVVLLQRIAEVADAPVRMAAVREIITAGEQMRITPAVTRLMEALRGCVLYNYYGPSETHNATALRLDPPASRWESAPPIGFPIWNIRCYVLNEAMQPVPRGAIGELFIGGIALARGYWRDPALTAERFLPDPFAADGSRLYRTGDRVRHRPDGALEFIGRADTQVKLRGYRIEPGEVETVLLEIAPLREAFVTLRGDAAEPQLVAYVVPHQTPGPTARALRAALRGRLPEYMIPSAFVPLAALPLNQNGKVDRAALPAVAPIATPGLAPRSRAEAMVARAVCDVLTRDAVGVEANFFDLGAHSLSLAQIANRLSHWFGIDLQVSVVFANPTVEALTDVVRAQLPPEHEESATAPLSGTAGGGDNP